MKLYPNQTWHFEVLRMLAAARYGGCAANEVLQTIDGLKDGDFESWFRVWNSLAVTVERTVQAPTTHPIAVRDAMFRAASYYRAADFFLHGNWDDPRIDSLWSKQRACFDKALSLLPIPAERVTIPTNGFNVSAIYYRASRE